MTFQHLRVVPVKAKQAAKATAVGPCLIEPLPGWNKRQFAIFLLQTAADIEHALMVQYLYAAYSLPSGDAAVTVKDTKTGLPVLKDPNKDPKDPENQVTTDDWEVEIAKIAKEEMGHLMSVQCLLRSLGGPIGFDREHFPYRSDLYPFPFTLEPLTKNSLARYVLAEMPDPALVTELTPAEIEAIQERATRDTGGVSINHVGMLYDTLIKVVHDLDETDFRQDAIPYQPDDIKNSWRANEDDNDKGVKVLPIRPRPDGKATKLRDVAEFALRIIARQGEGRTSMTMTGRAADEKDNSHFMRFLSIYKHFPDGQDLAWPVATNPNTTVPLCPALNQPSDPEAALQEQKNRPGRIVNPITLLWAHLFNIRYRILLAELHHYLLLRSDCKEQNEVRGRLVQWVFKEMSGRRGSSIKDLAQMQLTGLDQYTFPGFKAGAPFEVPYTFDLPDRGPDRWRLHHDLYEGSHDLVAQIESELKKAGQPVPKLLADLTTFEKDDDGFETPAVGRIEYIDRHKNSEF